jgi:sulfite reductase (NADPH) flavoprotein alpha-component
MHGMTLRALVAGTTVLTYAGLCLAIYLRQRARQRAASRAAATLAETTNTNGGSASGPATLVLFASQTGQSESIAWRTARWLHAAGTPVRVMPLNELDASLLQETRSAFFVASTYGEGDAPDNASVFAEMVMTLPLRLPSLQYTVLALGDHQYTQFCGFGRVLDEWLQSTGAAPRFARIDVDNSDPALLAKWQTQCNGGVDMATDPDPADAFTPWQLVTRELLNTGSAGGPVFHLGLRSPTGTRAHWESGDLAQIALAHDPARPRDYSIASITPDGELQLLVRQERHPDGTLGAASGLLTSTLAMGDTVALRIRAHRNFRLETNADRPLILIGNGTGMAGLRSHLRARAIAGQLDNWLLLGERNAAHDSLYRDEIDAWQTSGVLRRVDKVFSRDQAERTYVQHRLLQANEELIAWIARGAAIYVCGSLLGMAAGVDAALRQVLGEAAMRELVAAGRYRRDVY